MNHFTGPPLLVGCVDCRLLAPLFSGARDTLILRNPGNMVPRFGAGVSGEAATLEHAVETLGVRDVVVVGHTGCAVMRLLMERPASRRPSAMDAFLRHAESVRRTVATRAGRAFGDELTDSAARWNVVAQLENTRTHPAVLVRERTPDAVRLHGWLLDGTTGGLQTFVPQRDRFERLGAPVRLRRR